MFRRRASLPQASRFTSIYLLFAIIASMAVGRLGSAFWYFSELQVAMAFVLGVGTCSYVTKSGKIKNNAWLLALQLVLYWQILFLSDYHHHLRTNYKNEIAEVKALIDGANGTVIADTYMGLLALAGRPIYLDPTQMTQLSYKGRWGQDSFLTELRKGEFELILLEGGPISTIMWTPEMLQAIHERYRCVKVIGQTEVWSK
jgi:hypothetical protein